MSVAFAVFTSDPNLMPCELFRLRDQISLTDGPVTAVGCGTFAQEEVLLQRYPSGVLSPGSLFQAWDGIQSEALLYHASLLPPGTSLEEDTQPFRYHRWMFCHNGLIRDFPGIRSRLLSLIPEHLQRRLRGDTDSKACFALFLKLLHDSNRTDDIQLEAALATQLLCKTVRTLEQLSSEAGDSPPTGGCWWPPAAEARSCFIACSRAPPAASAAASSLRCPTPGLRSGPTGAGRALQSRRIYAIRPAGLKSRMAALSPSGAI